MKQFKQPIRNPSNAPNRTMEFSSFFIIFRMKKIY